MEVSPLPRVVRSQLGPNPNAAHAARGGGGATDSNYSGQKVLVKDLETDNETQGSFEIEVSCITVTTSRVILLHGEEYRAGSEFTKV